MTRQPTLCGLVLADSSPILLEGLLRKFSVEPGFHVLASCTTGTDALRAVLEHSADVLVLDLRIARAHAFDVLKDLEARRTPCRVVLLADRVSKHDLAEATRLGTSGVALRSMPSDDLVLFVRSVHAGDGVLQSISTDPAADESPNQMSPRQLEIAELVARGYTNAEVAERLAISEGTVKGHLHFLYKKLGISGRLALALYATRGISLRRLPRSAA